MRHLTRKSVRDLERSISENTKNNPKKFWKHVNQKRKIKSPVASLYRTKDKDKDGLVDRDFDKAKTLVNQFTSVFSQESDFEWDLPEHPNFTNDQQVIFSSEVINKSPGQDSINSRILVELADSITPSLSIIFQNSYNTGTVPPSWKEANITPIFKKGDKKDPKIIVQLVWQAFYVKLWNLCVKITYLIFYVRTIVCQIDDMVFFLADLLYSNFEMCYTNGQKLSIMAITLMLFIMTLRKLSIKYRING